MCRKVSNIQFVILCVDRRKAGKQRGGVRAAAEMKVSSYGNVIVQTVVFLAFDHSDVTSCFPHIPKE